MYISVIYVSVVSVIVDRGYVSTLLKHEKAYSSDVADVS